MNYMTFFCFQDKCHEIADKYIEFEPIVVVIDLVLLSRPTYRHVLYNTDFKVIYFPCLSSKFPHLTKCFSLLGPLEIIIDHMFARCVYFLVK